MNSKCITLLLSLLSLLAATAAQAQPASTLKKIADARSITLGYRTEAAPFSFRGPDGQPAGYSVDLCKRVVASLEQQLMVTLATRWVPVTATNRIEQVTSGAIDLECGTTTVTLGRLEQVDFSGMIFVDGASFVSVGATGPRRLVDLAGKRIGVLAGSTTEPRLRAALKERKIEAQVVVLRDEREGVNALTEKRIDAFANDRLALVGRVLVAKSTGEFTLADEDFSFEPYALMMRRDAAFRLAVNRALARIYAGAELVEVYNRWFGELGRPGALLSAMFYLNVLGE